MKAGDCDGPGEGHALASVDCVDAHFHLWDLNRFHYPWPTREDGLLYRNFSIDEYRQAVGPTPIRHGVFVQVLNGSIEETEWACDLAEENFIIKGVVAGIDVTNEQLAAVLDKMAPRTKIVGVRHILDMEKDDWLTRNDVISGLKILEKRDIPFDLLLRPTLIKYVPQLSKKLPRLRMVVDHCAKPYIRDGKFLQWAEEMSAMAANPNIYCKISGLVTEADWSTWKPEHLESYVQHVLEAFGPARCMFGSDWPVCGLAGASLADVFYVIKRLVSKYSPDHVKAIFRDNAAEFYRVQL